LAGISKDLPFTDISFPPIYVCICTASALVKMKSERSVSFPSPKSACETNESAEFLYCPELYCTPRKHPRCPEPPRLQDKYCFCCSYHESSDIQSEEEDFQPAAWLPAPEQLSFGQIDHYTIAKSTPIPKQEKASQCDLEPGGLSLAEASHWKVVSLTPCIARHPNPFTESGHIPLLTCVLPEACAATWIRLKHKEAFVCKYCSTAFKSGQAMGGHMSRRHKVSALLSR